MSLLNVIRDFRRKIVLGLPEPISFFLLKKVNKNIGIDIVNSIKLHNRRYCIYKSGDVYQASESILGLVPYAHRLREANRIALWRYKVKPGDVVIEIGGGLGEEAVVLAKMVGEKGKVHTIEANPKIYAILKEVGERNKFTNLEIHNVALSDTNKTLEIVDNMDSYLSGSLFNEPNSNKDKTFTVEGRTLDTFIEENNISQVDYLKVNIEGAERFLVSDAKKYLGIVKNMAIACHDFRFVVEGNDFFRTKELITNFLKQEGFKVSHQNTGFGYIDDWVYAERP